MYCVQISGSFSTSQAVRTVSRHSEEEWCTSETEADPEVEPSNSGQSGMLSKVADSKKIAVANAINFETRETKFKGYPPLS
jgi:hypothetical protein